MSKRSGVFLKLNGSNVTSKMTKLSKTVRENMSPQKYIEPMERALDIIGDDADNHTPFDTGNLMDSQYRRVDFDGNQIVGRVGYWTSQAPYALRVHEDPNMRFRRPDAEHQWLWKALERKIPDVIRELNKT